MKSYLTLFLICSLILLMGCKKHSDSGCNENLLGTITLTPEERLIQPYGLHDSLVFYNDSLNNQVTLTCRESVSQFTRYGENGVFQLLMILHIPSMDLRSEWKLFIPTFNISRAYLLFVRIPCIHIQIILQGLPNFSIH